MTAVQRPEELHPRVMARVAECVEIVRARLHDFPAPAVGYFTGRAAAGLAYLREHRIELHREVLRAHPEESLRDTVAHEMAHLACFYAAQRRLIPGNGTGHGRHWQGIMRTWFGIEPARTTNVGAEVCGARRQHRWRADCGCPEGCRITTARRNKMLRGALYRCRRCAQRIAFPDERAS